MQLHERPEAKGTSSAAPRSPLWPSPWLPMGPLPGVLSLFPHYPHPACSGPPAPPRTHCPTYFRPSCFNTFILSFFSRNCAHWPLRDPKPIFPMPVPTHDMSIQGGARFPWVGRRLMLKGRGASSLPGLTCCWLHM